MGRTYPEITDPLRAFIEAQKVFFVATAPLSGDGRVNVSPKGLDALRVLGPREVGYVDYNGSGVETIAHIRENGRLILMFCAFEGKALIVRLYGRGRVVEPADAGFAQLLARFAPAAPARSIVLLDVDRVTDSCGHGVPLYEYKGERDLIPKWADRKGAEGLAACQREKNAKSIDGLQGLRSAQPG